MKFVKFQGVHQASVYVNPELVFSVTGEEDHTFIQAADRLVIVIADADEVVRRLEASSVDDLGVGSE